jgi:hypothetical protein
MEKLHIKSYMGSPFSTEVSTVKNKDGAWDSTKVSIFRNEVLIGEYLRNYPSYAALTFHPFTVGGEWYALYSAHYTAVRVMKLHKDRIEDWCGQDPTTDGFCPVEIYVPRYRSVKSSFESGGKTHEFETYAVDCDYKTEEDFTADMPEFDSEQYTDFGFLCGCVWGDDTSWKILYIDLAGVPNKVLSITSKFGYWEMPRSLTLKQCVDMSGWEPDHHWISLTRAEHINLKTNERC